MARWVDTKGYAEYVGKSRDAALMELHRGVGPPACKVNSRWLFDLDEVDRWIRQHAVSGAGGCNPRHRSDKATSSPVTNVKEGSSREEP